MAESIADSPAAPVAPTPEDRIATLIREAEARGYERGLVDREDQRLDRERDEKRWQEDRVLQADARKVDREKKAGQLAYDRRWHRIYFITVVVAALLLFVSYLHASKLRYALDLERVVQGLDVPSVDPASTPACTVTVPPSTAGK